MYLTPKQQELLDLVARRNPDGSPLDIDQLRSSASYAPSKDAMLFTVRALGKHGLIEKTGSALRRDRRHTLLEATPLGLHFSTKARAVPYVVSEADDLAISELENVFE